MKCPYCSTENRQDRESCYHCGKDISMLRLIVNKARHHYNVALEHAERQRYDEALAELQHSLELDHDFAPAHVVMGTVYAKMERYAEARQAWEEALTLDPHIRKAHDYIAKSDIVETAEPLVRRFKKWTVAAAVLGGIFVVLSLWHLGVILFSGPAGEANVQPPSAPPEQEKQVAQVVAQIEEGQLAAAIDGIRRLRDAESPSVRQSAELLETAIEQRFEAIAADMMNLLLENQPLKAHRLFAETVGETEPPARYMRLIEPLDRRAAQQVLGTLEELEDRLTAGAIEYQAAVSRARELQEAFDQAVVREKAAEVLAFAGQIQSREVLDALPAEIESTTETVRWLGRLRDLAETVPQAEDPATSASRRLLGQAVSRIEQRVGRAFEVGDAQTLQNALEQLTLLEPYGLPEEGEALADRIRTEFRAIQPGGLAAFLEEATIDDIPRVAMATSHFAHVSSPTVENAEALMETVVQARRRLALEMLRWMEARDPRYETRRISEEEAQFTVNRSEFVLRYVRAGDWRYVRDNTMFYTMVAWLELGNESQARAWFDRLVETYPESPYVPTARRILGGRR